jgi:BirA family biotin operon repressor/biotin-[acetyl-CoA-carboxylase] ligase
VTHAPDRARHARVVRLRVVDSTQAIAFTLAGQGAADGTAVVADYQRLGRGRLGRRWQAEAGESLLVSIIVRSPLPVRMLPQYSFAAALATADAVEHLASVAPRLKWPNDVLLGGRKVAGVLAESRTGGGSGSEAPVVVVGIGLNLRQSGFDAAIADTATSVRMETGLERSVDDALGPVLERFGGWRARLERDGFGALRTRWLAIADTVGRRVAIDGMTGVAVDLADDGALLVEHGGARRRIVAGELTVVTPGEVGS